MKKHELFARWTISSNMVGACVSELEVWATYVRTYLLTHVCSGNLLFRTLENLNNCINRTFGYGPNFSYTYEWYTGATLENQDTFGGPKSVCINRFHCVHTYVRTYSMYVRMCVRMSVSVSRCIRVHMYVSCFRMWATLGFL